MVGNLDSSMASSRVVVADPERPADRSRAAQVRAGLHVVVDSVRAHSVLAGVIAFYLLTLLVVPVTANVTVLDDWVYIRQAHELAFHGNLHVPDDAAANAVFDIAWGALFARVFGSSLWVLRLSSITLTLIGGVAFYWLCRRLGADRTLSGLATGLVVFNPLIYVLSFTYMTDAHFAMLVVIATAAYVRGLGDDPAAARWTWVASGVAALAYLSRQQGLLVPLAVGAFLVLSRRLRFDAAGLRLLLRVAAVPAVVVVAHRIWLEVANGVPAAQEHFLTVVREAGVGETTLLVERLTFIEMMYVGLFALPLVAGMVLGVRRLVTRMPVAGWVAFGGWFTVIVVGYTAFGRDTRRMPYLLNWFTPLGLGSYDLIGNVPGLLTFGMRHRLTQASALGAVAVGFVVLRAMADRTTIRRPEAGLVVTMLFAVLLGALAPSFQYRLIDASPSLDRYLLPIFPLAIALVVWSTYRIPMSRLIVGVGVVAALVFSAMGTRDSLVFQRAVWDEARALTDEGIAETEIDAGAGWVGYHLHGRESATGLAVERPEDIPNPWWIYDSEGVALTDSTYVIATTPLEGYEVVRRVPFSSWLQTRETELLVLERQR